FHMKLSGLKPGVFRRCHKNPHVRCGFFCVSKNFILLVFYASAKTFPSSSLTCSLVYSLWKSFIKRSI
ncbi:MAG: hypothetical protein IJ997_03465, partial [Mycoplasmataceae bacterium]|nr:hypothetical protein [Mycoplasmataceae bacterium]